MDINSKKAFFNGFKVAPDQPCYIDIMVNLPGGHYEEVV